MPLNRSEKIDLGALAIASVGLFLSIYALVLASTIPSDLDQRAWNRQLKQYCLDSTIDLRGATGSLQGIYTVGTSDKNAAETQWQATQLAIDRTQVSCANQLSPELIAQGSRLFSLFMTAQEQADAGHWDATNPGEILAWTQDAIRELTS